MLRGRESRSLTRYWAWIADFEPCECAWTWLYKYPHHQTSTTPQPCGWSRLDSSLRATRCNGLPTSVGPEYRKEKPWQRASTKPAPRQCFQNAISEALIVANQNLVFTGQF